MNPKDKLDEIINLMEHHYKEMLPYHRFSQQEFTYEKHKYTSCMMCGHSDKALIHELKKLRKLL